MQDPARDKTKYLRFGWPDSEHVLGRMIEAGTIFILLISGLGFTGLVTYLWPGPAALAILVLISNPGRGGFRSTAPDDRGHAPPGSPDRRRR